MKRVAVAPRPDWEARLKAAGFDDYIRPDGTFYWIEDACFEFTAREIETLTTAARTCEGLVNDVIARAVAHGTLGQLGLDTNLARLAQISWRRRDPPL